MCPRQRHIRASTATWGLRLFLQNEPAGLLTALLDSGWSLNQQGCQTVSFLVLHCALFDLAVSKYQVAHISYLPRFNYLLISATHARDRGEYP